MSQIVKYVTREHLLQLRKLEKKRGKDFNQAPSDGWLKKAKPGVKYPVAFHFIHNDKEIRVLSRFDSKGGLIIVDMPFDFFSKLPEQEV